MNITVQKEFESIQQTVDRICYSFYRYEIKQGLGSLDAFVNELASIIEPFGQKEDVLEEINQLLQMVLVAVEKQDYLIAADLLRYELLQRIALLTSAGS